MHRQAYWQQVYATKSERDASWFNDRFIRITNRSEYPPKEKNPKGEIHHDEGFFSMDRACKRIVLRQFHVEGFVNQYVQEADGALVFLSESRTSRPVSRRAKRTRASTPIISTNSLRWPNRDNRSPSTHARSSRA